MNKKNVLTQFDLEAAFTEMDKFDYSIKPESLKESRKVTYKKDTKILAEDLSTGAGFKRLFEELYDVEDPVELDAAAEDREDEIKAAKMDKIEKIIDLDAKTVDDIKQTYVGKVIIQCPQCMQTFFKDEEDIEKDPDDPSICNVNEPCQHCGNISGYELKGKVGAVDESELGEEDETDLEENEFDLDFPEDEEEDELETSEEEANDDLGLVDEEGEAGEGDDLDLDLDLDLDEDEMEESFNSQAGMTLHEEKLTESKLNEDASDVMHAYAEDDKYKTGLWFMISYVNPEKKEVEVTEPFQRDDAQKVIDQVKANGFKPRGAYFISDGSLGIANEEDLRAKFESLKKPYRAKQNDNAYSENEPKLNESLDEDDDLLAGCEAEEIDESLAITPDKVAAFCNDFKNDWMARKTDENLAEAVAVTISVDEVDDSVVANTPADAIIYDNGVDVAPIGTEAPIDTCVGDACGMQMVDTEQTAPVLDSAKADDALVVNTLAGDTAGTSDEEQETVAVDSVEISDEDSTDVDAEPEDEAEATDIEDEEEAEDVDESLKIRPDAIKDIYSENEPVLNEDLSDEDEVSYLRALVDDPNADISQAEFEDVITYDENANGDLVEESLTEAKDLTKYADNLSPEVQKLLTDRYGSIKSALNYWDYLGDELRKDPDGFSRETYKRLTDEKTMLDKLLYYKKSYDEVMSEARFQKVLRYSPMNGSWHESLYKSKQIIANDTEFKAEQDTLIEDYDFDDIDEIDEESISECISEALTDTYDNVSGFELDNAELGESAELKLEGLIKFKNGNVNTTTYRFTEAKKNSSGLITLSGINETYGNGGKFVLNVKNTKTKNGTTLVAESFSYKYEAEGRIVEGLTKRK